LREHADSMRALVLLGESLMGKGALGVAGATEKGCGYVQKVFRDPSGYQHESLKPVVETCK